MAQLTFAKLKVIAKKHGIVLERSGRHSQFYLYEYWNKKEGGRSVGSADTLKEAYEDMMSFADKPPQMKLSAVLEALDGAGLVVTDDDLIKETLKDLGLASESLVE